MRHVTTLPVKHKGIHLSFKLNNVDASIEYGIVKNNNDWIPITDPEKYVQRGQSGDGEVKPYHELNKEAEFLKKIVHRDTMNDEKYTALRQSRNMRSKCKDLGDALLKYYFNIANDFNKDILVYLINLSKSRCHDDDKIETGSIKKSPVSLFRYDRNPKKIPDGEENNLAHFENNRNEVYAEVDSNKHNILNERTYEVTEDTELDQNVGTTNNPLNYIHEKPENDLREGSLNTTAKLQDILSKYGININDDLPNYALSRRLTRSMPIKMPRYNNHLPLDPLLAVYLSNYGHYLPGVYGLNNKYYNLYGYLASNNIHNNRPFGSYKIFSDTDSSL
ncbi:uncharacterized protein LOC110385287 isoform X1 [Bombyx mori]|uniref:uncharacterized protein LOC110385287 isoform X1 n=1 Tax=Bombyx mori TaxID=7091 RepID=UPI002ED45B2E